MKIKPKRKGVGLEIRTTRDKKNREFIIFKHPKGSYHVFTEITAKELAREWDIEENNTREMIKDLFKKKRQ